MDTYLVRLTCRSPYLTPWRSCTLWGRLSWIVADGRLPGWSIQDWIECYRAGIPPLVVGDAFPYDAVPVPALYLATATGPQKRPKTLLWPDWLELCQSGDWPESPQSHKAHRVERMHVVIARDSGTTVDGGLRTEAGEWPAKGLVLLAQVDETLGESGLRVLMEELCKDGWGQGRTYGYGHIELTSIEPIDRPQRTGQVATLGHCHPTDDLPEVGYWRWTGVPVRPHDQDSRRGEKQFFTMMLLPGACFAAQTGERVGQAIRIEGRPDYRHYGIAPTWPVMEVIRA